ncbi:MAG: hypothetical protein L3J24_09635 [Xanthomonadales bacterium]|nr:hypothetical protein [Xanthomonadales bacterium]
MAFDEFGVKRGQQSNSTTHLSLKAIYSDIDITGTPEIMFFNKKPKYLIATPTSAYYFTQNNMRQWQKDVLTRLFSLPKSPALNDKTLSALFLTSNSAQIEYKLNECIKLKILQIVTKEVAAPADQLENNLKSLIQALSQKEKALLSDSQGLCIVNHGFTDAMSEEISALSVEVAILHGRRAVGICTKLKINSKAWAITDISGKSCLGFWPLAIGEEVFVLVIEGEPSLQHPAMTSLVWMLYSRYGKNKRKSRWRRQGQA